MALPKLETPSYELILPSTGQKIKYRPFLVKEYKILLTSLDSDTEEIQRVITDLVDVCTYNKLKINEIPSFDIEYIFLNLRAKSIGEKTNLTLECTSCSTKIQFELDLTKAEVKKNPNHSTKLFITDTIGLEMRYPRFDELMNIYKDFKSDNVVELLCMCIKSVFTEEENYDNYTKEEMLEFVNSFSKAQFDILEQFFLTMPKVVQHIEHDCPNCGAKNETNLVGLQNFFA